MTTPSHQLTSDSAELGRLPGSTMRRVGRTDVEDDWTWQRTALGRTRAEHTWLHIRSMATG
ncbi:hypothetical protein [Streptomyces wuyuanensis]|uniref:hypothetical protein n=1 Tax=Streptomyces wuyuanensis TaxID=1196353 RepID=UPI00371CC51A